MADSLLLDLLDQELLDDGPRIITQNVFDSITQNAIEFPASKSKTVGKAKSLLEFFDLVRQGIDNYEDRAGTPQKNRVIFTEEEPDVASRTESITFSLINRQPGAFGQGPPNKAQVHNRRPIVRESVTDPENPKYKIIELGFWYDNVVRFTCWARTNKAANQRATWFENFMAEYEWWFVMQGTNRVLWDGQGRDIVAIVNENKWYGRPIDFFVKTETVRTYRQKTLEEIIVRTSAVRDMR